MKRILGLALWVSFCLNTSCGSLGEGGIDFFENDVDHKAIAIDPIDGFLVKEFQPEAPVCLVVGNEITGVGEEILPFCDAAIEIEMAGLKNSLNVTVAFGIIAYHFRNILKPRLLTGSI